MDCIEKICVLKGSPRKNGNTNSLLSPLIEALKEKGYHCAEYDLYEMDLKSCNACRKCQMNLSVFGCPQNDDMKQIFDSVMESQTIILATPIYSWYCTPAMKTVLDRLVYGMNKYYGETKGTALWAGKSLALVTTCGYPPKQGADLWEEGMKRYCRHSQLQYKGMLAERHTSYNTTFMDPEKKEHAEAFAKIVIK